MNIGIIGYGSMGRMLVEKLSKNKDNRLYVYNRTIEKLKSLPPEINICSSNSDLGHLRLILSLCVCAPLISNLYSLKFLILYALKH